MHDILESTSCEVYLYLSFHYGSDSIGYSSDMAHQLSITRIYLDTLHISRCKIGDITIPSQ